MAAHTVAHTAMKPNAPVAQTSCSRQTERDQRVLEHMHLVRIIAIKIYEGLPVYIELDELIQVGTLGLLEAAEKFDSEKNVTFSAYAKHRIRGAILDSLRQMDWASRDQRKRCRQLESAVHTLSGVLGRNPTDAEVATEMGMELPKWQQMVGELQSRSPVSISARPPGQPDAPLPEHPASERDNPDNACKRNEVTAMLREAILSLPIRYQSVVRMYYTDDMTMKEIGSILGVNESRVSQIHKLALRKMATLLTSEGICASAVL